MEPDELVRAGEVVYLVARINKRYPHVYLPGFVNELIDGTSTTKLIRKYNIQNYNAFAYLVRNILEFVGPRSSYDGQDNRALNLSNPKWNKRYDLIISQCSKFAQQISELLYYRILETLLIYTVLDEQHIRYGDIEDAVRDVYSKVGNPLTLLEDDSVRIAFEDYMRRDLRAKLDDIAAELANDRRITCINGDITMPEKYLHVEDELYDMIENSQKGISYKSLISHIQNEFPLLGMLFSLRRVDAMLNKLEEEGKLVRKRAFWKLSPMSDQLFTRNNYATVMESARIEYVQTGKTKFFGRMITPDQFIEELKELRPGDLDDLDDQVTRIAGLVLSDAAMLQSPGETMEEFDFVVDTANYHFRPEQVALMEKLDFQANSNIFHCKVMINKEVTVFDLENLKKSIPEGEQGVLFTCRPVDPPVRQITLEDRTVQIIDEEGIREWCQITPTIPCRRHSVARIMYGEGAGSIVLVKSLNYESGRAIVEIIPESSETTFPIGCMKEIDLHVSYNMDFESASNDYFEFVSILANLSGDDFKTGMALGVSAIHPTYESLQHSIHPEHYGGIHPPIVPAPKEDGVSTYVEFENVYAKLRHSSSNPDNHFQCTCSKHLNEIHYHTLCSHLVSAINHYCVDCNNWPAVDKRIKILAKKLKEFQAVNLQRAAQAVYDVLDTEHRRLFIRYLEAHSETE